MIAAHCAIQCHRLHRLGTGPAQRVQKIGRCDDIKIEMRPEERIAAGKSINEALTAFSESVSQLGPLHALVNVLENLDHRRIAAPGQWTGAEFVARPDGNREPRSSRRISSGES